MSPVQRAKNVYFWEPCVRTFQEDLELHLINGYVFSTPEFFIMGRGVKRDAPQDQIVDPSYCFPREEQDCWHVYLMSGDVRKVWDILPYSLPFISFERKNELRFYKSEDINRFSYAFTP